MSEASKPNLAEIESSIENAKPLFDAGAFSVIALALDPNKGLTIQTRKSKSKNPALDSEDSLKHNPKYPFVKESSSLDEDPKALQLKNSMRDEMVFMIKNSLKNSELSDLQRIVYLDSLFLSDKEIITILNLKTKENTDEDAISTLSDRRRNAQEQNISISQELKAKQSESYTKIKPKVGIRNIHVAGDMVEMDIVPVLFPNYDTLAKRGEENQDVLDYGEATGTAAIIVTKLDEKGEQQMILQYRAPWNNEAKTGNKSYGGIPGASAAGLFEGRFDPNKAGYLMPIDVNTVKENLLKEAEEELLENPSTMQVTVLGVVHDELKPHHEIVLTGTINKTANKLKGLIPVDDVNIKEGDLDFNERYLALPYNINALTTLLTEVKCPLPPTHAAAFFTAAYNMVAAEKGKEAADDWGYAAQEKIKANYVEIDNLAKKGGEEKGYNPSKSPNEQGLPELFNELKRTGLISEQMYSRLTKKHKIA
jgi:hypothetical protein